MIFERVERDVLDPLDGTELSRELVGLSHVDEVHLGEIRRDPVGLDLGDPRVGQHERRPVSDARIDALLRATRDEIGGHRLGDVSGMGQLEVLKVSHEIDLAGPPTDPRIEGFLLSDGGGGASGVVVTWEDQARLGEREQLTLDRVEKM